MNSTFFHALTGGTIEEESIAVGEGHSEIAELLRNNGAK